jgi:hypothetical protein
MAGVFFMEPGKLWLVDVHRPAVAMKGIRDEGNSADDHACT